MRKVDRAEEDKHKDRERRVKSLRDGNGWLLREFDRGTIVQKPLRGQKCEDQQGGG